MKIGYRTIKTAIGAPTAILIAQLLGLTNFISAGILVILCIQPSRGRSMISAWDRLIACIIMMVFSYALFEVIGYNPVVIGLILLLFIPVTVFLNVSQGIVTSSVIMLNLYSTGSITFLLIQEQFLIILIGIGIALLLNLYMPSLDNKLKANQKTLEESFQRILYEISLFIREKNMDWDGQEVLVAEDILEEANRLVALDKENHLLRNEHTYYDYFTMRSKQLELLKRMLPLVSKLENIADVSGKTADFFEELSESVHPGNTAIIHLEELERLQEVFREEALPTTREAFETRANLFRLSEEIEAYLIAKDRFVASRIIKKNKREKKKKTGMV